MKCVKCGGKTKVLRVIQSGKRVIRYRRCTTCGATFKTVEE